MARKSPTAATEAENQQVVELQTGRVSFCIRSITPLIYNAMSFKVKGGLLFPLPKKNAVERASTLKHEPMSEYRNSTYKHRDNDHPTRLFFPAGGLKKAMMQAALRLPGMKKSETGQLLWVEGRDVDIYGEPQIYMAVTRSADINRTPDVRTRAILPQWAAKLTIQYVKPQFSDKQVVSLLAAAGLLCGIGDARQEKGQGHGQFEIVSQDDPTFKAILANGGLKIQDKALENPDAFDLETEQLLDYYNAEVEKLGDRIAKKPTRAASEKVFEDA